MALPLLPALGDVLAKFVFEQTLQWTLMILKLSGAPTARIENASAVKQEATDLLWTVVKVN
jgi:hypothetical protein